MLILPPDDLEKQELVGTGGFGVVYRVWSKTLNMMVALKMMKGSNLETEKRELEKERDMMQKASNPYVLRLLAMYEKKEGNIIENCLVMEYMPHGSLHALMQHIPDIPWALKFRIFHQVALGMNYLHSLNPPIIHRDLKPGNVLLNENLKVQITDFGLSKISGAISSTKPGRKGTLKYMPPEALSDVNYKPCKTFDIYSYGILMWSVFSGAEPYHGICVPDLIVLHVTGGQRPDLNRFDQMKGVKMVPEATILMTSCWSGNVEERPTFHVCSLKAGEMFAEYEGQVDGDMRSVLASLKGAYSSHQFPETAEDLPTPANFSPVSKGFCTDHEFTRGTQEPLQEPGPEGVDLGEASNYAEKESPAMPTIDISSKEAAIRTVTDTIKQSRDFIRIVNILSDEDILPSAAKRELDGAPTLKDIGQAAEKALRDTICKEPEKLLSSIKKLWN
uniref:Protein kinase domain-containing protein n=1 Tax=Leptobrachium leishanense TaxID=445787 RepID=A0A8C5QMJ9_9ANUR